MSFWVCALCVCARNGATSSALAPTSNSIRFIGCYLLWFILRQLAAPVSLGATCIGAEVSGGTDPFVRCALAYSSGLLLSSIEFRMPVATGLCLRD